jgi:hypothetical protein
MSYASVHRLPQARRPAVPVTGLDELRRLEADLASEWEQLQRARHGYAGVRSALAEPTAGAAELSHFLRQADRQQEAFLARLDEFQRRMHAHFMDQVVRELDCAVDTLSGFYGRGRIRSVIRAHRRLAKLAERYRELEPLYGTNRDHRRIAAYQRFFAGTVAFSQRIGRLDPTAPESWPPSLSARLARAGPALAWRVRRLPTAVRLVWNALRLLVTLLSGKQSATGTAFTNRVDDFFRTWGEALGCEVCVSGGEHLEDDGTLTLVTPAHRHGITDNVTFAHLRLPDYLVFNAVDQLPVVPKFLKDRIASTRGLIAVGDGRGSAVERALEALAQGVSRNVLIYPEGSVSEGFRGTRPPRPNFGAGLVQRIREAGYAVRIAPVSYLDNARFLELPPRAAARADRRLRVVVSEPLADAAVDALFAAGGGPMLNRMVRLAWLESLVTDGQNFLGHDRVAEVEARLDREFDGIRYWGSLESAPVRERLRTRAVEPLAAREEPFQGKRVRVFEIPASAREADDKIVLPDLACDDSHELLIGIRAPSHIYLNLGSCRFDGDIFRPLRVRERDYAYPGIIIRLVGVPVKSLHAVRRKLEELSGREYRTLTCANSACRLIARAANIEIADHADMRPFLPSHVLPTRTIRKIIEHGVRSHTGESIETQIYKTDDRSLEETLAEMRREEIRIAREHLEVLTLGAWRAAVARSRGLRRRLRGRSDAP